MTQLAKTDFVRHLYSLVESAHAMGVLRRSIETVDPRAHQYVMPRIPSHHVGDVDKERIYYAVAALCAWNHHKCREGENMGKLLKRYAQAHHEQRGHIDTVLKIMLDSQPDQLIHHLWWAVKKLKESNLGVDYDVLLEDLLEWADHGRAAQWRWAKEFWGTSPS